MYSVYLLLHICYDVLVAVLAFGFCETKLEQHCELALSSRKWNFCN